MPNHRLSSMPGSNPASRSPRAARYARASRMNALTSLAACAAVSPTALFMARVCSACSFCSISSRSASWPMSNCGSPLGKQPALDVNSASAHPNTPRSSCGLRASIRACRIRARSACSSAFEEAPGSGRSSARNRCRARATSSSSTVPSAAAARSTSAKTPCRIALRHPQTEPRRPRGNGILQHCRRSARSRGISSSSGELSSPPRYILCVVK